MSTLHNNINPNTLFKEGIFIIHALKGYDFHEERIKKVFSDMNLGFEFVTDGDPSLFTKNIIEKYFVKNIDQILSKGILSCTLNHIFAYEKIVSRKLEYTVIFENDPYFLGNFKKKIEMLIPEIIKLPKGYII
jgi:glycosyl transferase family 25